MSAIRTHYDNLQVARNASPEVIRAAYKGLTQRYHPDRHTEDRPQYERIMRILNDAFAVLSNPRKRAKYDEWIRQQEAAEDETGSNEIPAYYAAAAQAFRNSRAAGYAAAYPAGMPEHEPRDRLGDGRPEQPCPGATGSSTVPPVAPVASVSRGQRNRVARGRRWAWNVAKIVGLTVVVWFVFAYRGNTFKGLVEAALLLLVGLVCAGIAFGLGWASAMVQPAPVGQDRVAPSVATAHSSEARDSSRWTGMDRLGVVLIGLIVCGMIYSAITHTGNQPHETAPKPAVDFASATAAKLSVGVPRMVSHDQRLDSVIADPHRAVIYTYTMLGIPNLHMDAETAGRFRQLVVASTCGGSSHELFVHGIAIRDRYLREDGYLVADVTVRPEDCARSGRQHHE